MQMSERTFVTVFGSVVLILLALWAWRTYEFVRFVIVVLGGQ